MLEAKVKIWLWWIAQVGYCSKAIINCGNVCTCCRRVLMPWKSLSDIVCASKSTITSWTQIKPIYTSNRSGPGLTTLQFWHMRSNSRVPRLLLLLIFHCPRLQSPPNLHPSFRRCLGHFVRFRELVSSLKKPCWPTNVQQAGNRHGFTTFSYPHVGKLEAHVRPFWRKVDASMYEE